MFVVSLNAPWAGWIAALAAPLHRRCAWRLAHVVVGILTVTGCRTASRWFRAAGLGEEFRSYSYFLDHIGRKANAVAMILFNPTARHLAPEARWDLPEGIDWEFRTRPQVAAEPITGAGSLTSEPDERPRVVVEGGIRQPKVSHASVSGQRKEGEGGRAGATASGVVEPGGGAPEPLRA